MEDIALSDGCPAYGCIKWWCLCESGHHSESCNKTGKLVPACRQTRTDEQQETGNKEQHQ